MPSSDINVHRKKIEITKFNDKKSCAFLCGEKGLPQQ
jgi:hypothetical protein